LVRSVQISGSLCVLLEHTFVSGVECLSGSLSSNKWFAVCTFGTHRYVSGVECLSGSLSSNKWFAVCNFGTHICLRGGMSKWFAQFK